MKNIFLLVLLIPLCQAGAEIILQLNDKKEVNAILLQEYIKLGQRIKSFRVEAEANDGFTVLSEGSTIGYKRILTFDPVITDAFRITNEELFREAIEPIARARSFVWIGTADIKDMHIPFRGRVNSFLTTLNELCKKRVEIRLLHAKEPGPNFRKSFDKYPLLIERMERQLCPRVHFKHIIIDGTFVYTGSANLTGAGLGIKGANTRNFESGIVSTSQDLVHAIMKQFDEVWMGKHCLKCQHREYCGDPIL